MSLLKPTLELILILIIVSVFRSHNVRIEESMAMFRLVVVSCAGAHVVCIWMYLNMNKWGGETEACGMGTYSIWEPGARQNGCTEHTRDKGHMRGIGCRQVCKCHTRHRPITKTQGKARRKAFLSVVTQELNQETGNNTREVILVNENVVVSWLARAEQACVAVEVIVRFNGAHDIGVYDRARAAVPFCVTDTIAPREEGYFVVLGNDNKRYCGFETKS
jgi:hypothetical protein